MRRRQGSRASMFFRMLLRAAARRKRTAISALLAIVIAAAAATAMLDLFADVQAKLRKEFRGFGANIVMQAKSDKNFAPAELRRINSIVGGRGLAVPFSYAVAHLPNGDPIVVAGTDFGLVRQLNPWWSVSSWPNNAGEALAGVRVARLMKAGSPLTFRYQDRAIHLSQAGTVQTGAGEDSRLYISLADFQSWTGLQPTVVEIAAYGSSAEISSLAGALNQSIPSADVHIVRQVTEGEANILAKTRSTLLWSSVFIICTAALCVLATFAGWLFDRRRDFAIMKAIGASDRLIALFICGEAAVLACAGALLGYFGGVGIAMWIGRANFHAPVSPRFDVFPPVLLGCIAVTLVATLLPLRLLRQIQPAMILRGE